MSEINGIMTNTKPKYDAPILHLIRLVYVKLNCKILESTNAKLEKYMVYASARMETDIAAGDCVEHGLKLLFERDAGFKEWLKVN